MRCVHFQLVSCQGIHLCLHSIHNSQDSDCLLRVTYETMVNPSGILAEMFPFDHDKQTILALWIWVLWSHPFWRKVFESLVFLAADTKPSFHRHNEST